MIITLLKIWNFRAIFSKHWAVPGLDNHEPQNAIILFWTERRSKKGIKNSLLIIHEENTTKNHKRVVSVYVIQIHVDLHKLKL